MPTSVDSMLSSTGPSWGWLAQWLLDHGQAGAHWLPLNWWAYYSLAAEDYRPPGDAIQKPPGASTRDAGTRRVGIQVADLNRSRLLIKGDRPGAGLGVPCS
jgi:hypothetical protein